MKIEVIFHTTGQLMGFLDRPEIPPSNETINFNGLPYKVMGHSNVVTTAPPSARPRIFVCPSR